MKQTAVEWLFNELELSQEYEYVKEILDQAKEMEKEQRQESFVEGYKTRALESNLIFDEKSEYHSKKLFQRIFKSK